MTAPQVAMRVGRIQRAVRRTIELCITIGLLCILSPIMLLGMLVVRMTSPGPALYSQTRLGLNGRQFAIYKIRTMHIDCEKHTGAIWSKPGDPRVTKFGRFLRSLHIDEIPQLLNILMGDMSLVGPRPERPEIAAKVEISMPDYRQRLRVHPGLTGLAQLLQPPDTGLDSVRSKLDIDVYYITNRTLLLDFLIIIATPLHILNVSHSFLTWLLHASSITRSNNRGPAQGSQPKDPLSVEPGYLG